MRTMAAAEAKSNFGALLDTAQRAPVTISKKGRPVAVVMSMEEYEAHEVMKLESLQRDLMAGIRQADQGELIDGDQVFDELL